VTGLDNSGKTTLLHLVREVYSEIQEVRRLPSDVKLRLRDGTRVFLREVDLGGVHYARLSDAFKGCHGLVFVFDSADTERWDEAMSEFKWLLTHPGLCSLPVIILANKQDTPDCRSAEQIAAQIEEELGSELQRWHVQACSCVQRLGISDVFDVLNSTRMCREGPRGTWDDSSCSRPLTKSAAKA